ncbi:zinc finger protein 16-like isoform X1 [Aricia agestis]|uniref:zinc finger protein 16-like isoform X1 n=1 Tax=Aricia agestis TaxID=91739 RepID=UPI001C207273|nr:zinc finger protein 16-like isoform X1 [Aricia agestis]
MNIDSEKMLVVNSSANLSQESQSFAETCNVLDGLENLANVCRTCANVTEFVIPIFVGEGLHNNLAQKIQQHLPIKISEDDVLPHVVCYQCASTILAWHDLVECCLQADVTLQQRISSLTNETELKKNSNQRLEDNEESSAKKSDDKRDDVARPIYRLEPAQAAAPPPVPPRTCTYCRAECPEPQLKEHLISTHSELLFRCDECDSYVDRQDFVEHMSQHAVEYAADAAGPLDDAGETRPADVPGDPGGRGGDRTGDGVENEDGEATGQERDGGASVNEDDFSDRSDAEYFGELPDSVFEAIEDSQDTHAADDGDRLSRTDAATPTVPVAPLAGPPVDGRKTKKERACPVCSKVYTASSSYFYHLKHAHGAGQQHECDVCGRRFSAKPTLAQHLLIHAAERPYACAQCGKTFRARAALYVHEQTHGGRRTHACGECGRSFRWRAHLERHRRRHEGGREHACDVCGRTFNVRADLLRHARTHAAAALPCPHCELRFAQPRYLRAHLNNKHAAEGGVVK